MIAVVDYDAGNLRSVETALRHLGASFVITDDPRELTSADKVIVPGVGDARAAMGRLDQAGLSDAIRGAVDRGDAVLGICLGSQIVLDRSEESDAQCLGVIPGEARAFDMRSGRKVPHMGWNTILEIAAHPLLRGIPEGSAFYFVHSFYPVPAGASDTLASCDYGERFAAVVGRDNVVATQFHPEKSGELGLKMLRNFLEWRP
ncbi:MAG: imidazole glycerol phosphate synthase subunit HisH [Spirochaetales bacterium]|nr:imidazole glycerol phosphate synthase subunit HisH [Spirochaetales bacterium]